MRYHFRAFSHLITIVFLLTTLTSCLEERKTASEESNTTSWFLGVKTARNLGGSPSAIKVEWSASERAVLYYRVYSLAEDSDTKLTNWVMIAEVPPDVTSFVHTNLNSGQVYSYKVQAVDLKDQEDGNTNSAATVAFEGIASATVTGKTTAVIGLNSSTGAFDEVRVYATPKYGGSKTLVATAKGNISTINVSNLRSGTTYHFSVNAYIGYLKSEDGNNVYVEDQTYSESFGSGTATDSSFAYRGVLNVQAFGAAPNAPLIPTTVEDPTFAINFPNFLENPRQRLVRLTWLPFTGSNSETKYKVVRIAGTNSVDTNTSTVCSSSTDKSCTVCTVTGKTTCDDINVAAPPKKYDYIITLVKRNVSTNDDWVEELPKINSDDFRVSVSVPPDYMVLVQRDAANYEMCRNMGRFSNPRKKQRCSYIGVGDRPFNSGPTKPPLNLNYGYYDFGYNLFVDRYRVACNWTRTPNACGKPEGCIHISAAHATDSSPPSNTIGVDGNVMYSIGSGGSNCYYKKGGSWLPISNNTLTPVERDKMTRIDPGPDGQKHYPPVNSTAAEFGYYTCQSKTTEYGPKRLLRRREHVVAAAFPTLAGEPNAVDDIASRLNLKFSKNGYKQYECPTTNTLSLLRPTPLSITEMLEPSNYRGQLSIYSTQLPRGVGHYFIGTQATIRCQNRWGGQDQISNNTTGTPLSDMFLRTNGTTNYPMQVRGEIPDFDPGNKDFLGIEFGTGMATNLPNDAVPGWKTVSMNLAGESSLGSSFIVPVGLNIMNWTSVATQDLWNFVDFIYNGLFSGDNFGINAATSRFTIFNGNYDKVQLNEGPLGRWSYTIYGFPNTASYESTLWCAVEAE